MRILKFFNPHRPAPARLRCPCSPPRVPPVRLAILLFAFAAGAGILSAEQYVYDSHGRRNPFLPPAGKKGPALSPDGSGAVDVEPFKKWFVEHMSGVLYDRGDPRVLIGDEIIEVGQEVNKCTIVEIRPDGIVFEYMAQRVDVPLRQEAEKENK